MECRKCGGARVKYHLGEKSHVTLIGDDMNVYNVMVFKRLNCFIKYHVTRLCRFSLIDIN